MDIENKENKQKPKKSAGEKRLIATQIAAGCFVAMTISSIPSIVMRGIYDKDIRVLDSEENAIYEQFIDSAEFGEYTDAQLIQLADDYTSNKIDYDTFREHLDKMFTIENAKEIIENSNNTELQSQIEDIKQQKQDRTEEFDSNVISNISVGGTLASGAGVFGSLLAAMIYAGKEFKEEKRKKKQTKNTGINGVKYYDSTSGTIRNTADPSYEEKVLDVPIHQEKYMPFYDEKYGVIRMLDNEDIEEQTETEENESGLNK